MNTLQIIHHDEYLVAVNKPAGMLVHRTALAAHEDGPFAMQVLRNQLGMHVYPVHRLDRPTSGVLVFALSSQVAAAMQCIFEGREVYKTYWTICRGYCDSTGTIESPLRHEESDVIQSAETSYKRLATAELPIANAKFPTSRYSLVEVTPKTGRMHQIRKHFAKLRHYIIGDTKHGDLRQNRAFLAYTGQGGLLLHAKKLEFLHPINHEQVSIEAPLPPHFEILLEALPWVYDN